ncbi:MAG: hypothetical protein R6W71_03975 [Bacteroidales bacterium]
MSRSLIFGILLFSICNITFSQVAINEDGSPPHPSAGLEIKFTDKGVLLPRLTAQQRDAIFEPADGLLIYCVDCGLDATGILCIFQNGGWRSFNLDCMVPMTPPPLSHTPGLNQIVWEWGSNPNTAGYKWHTINDYSTATDLFSDTTYTETGLDCWTEYTRYVWGYNECGPSIPLVMTQSTDMVPFSTPVTGGGGMNPTDTSITWGWTSVTGATGYRINDNDDFESAADAPTTFFYESGLTCLTTYNRYVWAYDACGYSTPTIISGSTIDNPPDPPGEGIHVPAVTQIEWNWELVPDADGYLWSTTNDTSTAIDKGNLTTHTQTDLLCNTTYNSYVWAYGPCGTSVSAQLTQKTDTDPPDAPLAATHVPSAYQIVWNWSVVADADGYRWNDTIDFESAEELGTQTTYTETGLDCDSLYTRYIWAYNECGVSVARVISATTLIDIPPAPTPGVNVPAIDQVVWKWNTVAGAIGYMWNDTNDFGSAVELGLATSYTETGLDCDSLYTRYVWAYNSCTASVAAVLTETTLYEVPVSPVAGTHVPSVNQIVWKWEQVAGAIGYRWGLTDNYAGSEDMLTDTSKTETGLACDMLYTRYVWAYNNCGHSASTVISANTLTDPPASPVAGSHVPTSYSIVWNWGAVMYAEGYRWGVTPVYEDADSLGNATSQTESGLKCDSAYVRYVWAYNNCGVSGPTTLNGSTTADPPATPAAGTHVPSEYQVVWHWEAVVGATGYKWHTMNNFNLATDMGTNTSHLETGIDCNTSLTRYVWAYNDCDSSGSIALTATTLMDPPAAPAGGTHTSGTTQITWNWVAVPEADGYKWNTTGNYSTALDLLNVTSITEDTLTCNLSYVRYVWAYSNCGVSDSTILTQATQADPPGAPLAGTHVPSGYQIQWNWNSVVGATGYRWSPVNNYDSAEVMGTATTKIQNSLACNEEYTSYVWAYGPCGVSVATIMTDSTLDESPGSPVAGTHGATAYSITWNWSAVSGATGYKWGKTDIYNDADSLGNVTSKSESDLDCDSLYTRYIWAYNDCGPSGYTVTSKVTSNAPPPVPTTGTHDITRESIDWKWNGSAGAVGYLWSDINDVGTAIDKGLNTSHFEDGLTCSQSYTRYVWAYNDCDTTSVRTLTQSTMICWQCGEPLFIDHIAGDVAAVTKSTTYGTVTDVPGEPTKCWTTSNLGSDHQATAVNDATEESAGWYWQFNRKQGYKHDGTTRTPNTTWITSINENSDWILDDDPCRIEFGSDWRIPTKVEWSNVKTAGNWVSSWTPLYESPLKLHAGGYLEYSGGTLQDRGVSGNFWSSTTSGWPSYHMGQALNFISNSVALQGFRKATGYSIRCIKD